MYRLLVVDDEEKIRSMIKKYAEFEKLSVIEACDGIEAIEICKMQDVDCIIMDIMMPELDGFSACKEIRKFSDKPIIMLSARGEEYDKIHGFELGIDDYVVKPFSPKELMMRINAVIRRYSGLKDAEAHEVYEKNGLNIDFTAHIVTIDGKKLSIAPKIYDLLVYLVKNKNIALTREQILSHVWGYDFYGDDRTLDTHIKLLRKELGQYADLIITLRGLGYRFEG
ncbi:MAG: response regulator transcription factor [Ruminococcaceae bacterium]|nr:response regulator transcription factor [Oscillospiraceae bacterium]